MNAEHNELTLAQKILIWIGKIASRNDVTIQNIKVPLGEKLSKWSEILPSDMLPVYNTLNGISFHFDIGGNSFNGLDLVGLDADGKRTFRPSNMSYGLPYQKAKSFGEYFLDDESQASISPDDEVLFFVGDDSSWGILMVGRGEDPTFYQWGNDGDTEFIGKSYTEIIEQGLERHFGTNWFADKIHPENQKLIDLLAQESPRKTFELTVNEMEELDANGYRHFLGRKKSTYTTHKFMEALGQSVPENWTPEQYGDWLAETFSDSSNFKVPLMKEIMKIMGNEKTKKAFEKYFMLGETEPVVRLKMTLRKVGGKFDSSGTSELLLRTLCSLPGSTFCHDYPNKDLILYTMYRKFGFYRPYLFDRDNSLDKNRNPDEVEYEMVVLKSRVTGLEAGKQYDSFILPEIYESEYLKINKEAVS